MNMERIVNRLFLTLLIAILINLCYAQSSYLRSYNNPNEIITNVRTICSKYSSNPYIVILEGINSQTDSSFTKVQGIDINGNMIDDYSNAYVGEPQTMSSGVCELNLMGNKLVTPTIKYSSDSLKWYFNWRYNCADQSTYEYFNGYYLPVAFDAILEFPTVIGNSYHRLWDFEDYLIGGIAVLNGVNACFILEVDDFGYNDEFGRMIFLQSLLRVSGVAKIDEGFLIIGEAENHKNRIVLVDNNNNLLWQNDLTESVGVASIPQITTPLMCCPRGSVYKPIFISYQDNNKTLHISRYQSRSLNDIYTMPLDSYIGAIPLDVWGPWVTFAYVKDGKQYICQMDTTGTLLWKRELPGIGNLGKNCLSHATDWDEEYNPTNFNLIGGCLPEGGYYLAKINNKNGQIDNDTISQPASFDVGFYPNPGKGDLHINLDIKHPGIAKLEIYNLKGQKIGTLMDEYYPAGKFKKHLNINSITTGHLASGIYLIKANLNGQKITKKITILN